MFGDMLNSEGNQNQIGGTSKYELIPTGRNILLEVEFDEKAKVKDVNKNQGIKTIKVAGIGAEEKTYKIGQKIAIKTYEYDKLEEIDKNLVFNKEKLSDKENNKNIKFYIISPWSILGYIE